jgi:hypothetical protein
VTIQFFVHDKFNFDTHTRGGSGSGSGLSLTEAVKLLIIKSNYRSMAICSPTVPTFVIIKCAFFSLSLSLPARSHSFNVHTPLKKEKIQDPPVEHDLV